MQPYFLPYLGYFQLMAAVDKFVLYDDVQFIVGGWINRNRILVNGKEFLFTLPLKGVSQNRLIHELALSPDNGWRDKLLETIRRAYARAPHFREIMPLLQTIIAFPDQNLAGYVAHSLAVIRSFLEIPTEIIPTSRVFANLDLKGPARLLDICQKLGANTYVNAPGGRALYHSEEFQRHGLALRFTETAPIQYDQATPGFHPGLSIVDVLMFNSRPEVKQFLSRVQLTA